MATEKLLPPIVGSNVPKQHTEPAKTDLIFEQSVVRQSNSNEQSYDVEAWRRVVEQNPHLLRLVVPTQAPFDDTVEKPAGANDTSNEVAINLPKQASADRSTIITSADDDLKQLMSTMYHDRLFVTGLRVSASRVTRLWPGSFAD